MMEKNQARLYVRNEPENQKNLQRI
jgi:hypothetical protein